MTVKDRCTECGWRPGRHAPWCAQDDTNPPAKTDGDRITFKSPHSGKTHKAKVVGFAQEDDGTLAYQIETLPAAGPRGMPLDFVPDEWIKR